MSNICKNCLVELGDEIDICPLCATPVNSEHGVSPPGGVSHTKMSDLRGEEKYLMQRVLLQITVTILVSGIMATLIIDLAVHRGITWSIYPVSVCLILLSYASILALWHTKIIYQMLTGWLLSSIFLILIGKLFPAGWAISLGIPLLVIFNLISLGLLAVFRYTKRKGLNLLAYSFVGIALLCMGIEGIISKYLTGVVHLGWSVIVAGCLFPVTAALMFMFYRSRNNPTIQKIFHT